MGHEVARPGAGIELLPDQLLPAEPAGAGGARQAADEGAIREPGQRPALHGRALDLGEGELAEQLAEALQVVLINGGTGFIEKNRVPEAVGVLFERTVQGFGELFRQLSFAEIKGSAMQSRALAGLANRTLICCLPGSTGACRLGWEQLIREQLDARTRPCNFVTHL
jgi:molybdopterin biosynthesis enzyme